VCVNRLRDSASTRASSTHSLYVRFFPPSAHYYLGVRNPFDRILKNTAEVEARAVMHLFGALSLDEPAEVTELGREIGLEAVHFDHLYEVRTPTLRCLQHLEFQARYETDLPRRVSEYEQYTYLRYRLPVYTSLVMLVQKYAPAIVPDSFHTEAGGLTIHCQYRVIRMWELDPRQIFDLGRPALLPLIPLVGHERSDLKRAARMIADTGNKSLAGAFVTLGTMRYDQNELEGLLEKMLLEDIIKPEWVRDTWLVQSFVEQAAKEAREKALIDGLEEGRGKGLEEGRVEGLGLGVGQGRAEEARRMLAIMITTRFPSLTMPAAIQLLTDTEMIEDLARAILTAKSPAEAETVLQRATAAAPAE
jgi:predicted transposase YdaD